MPRNELTREFLEQVWSDYRECGFNTTHLAQKHERSRNTVRHWVNAAKGSLGVTVSATPIDQPREEFKIAPPVDNDLSVAEIVAIRKRQFEQRKKHEEESRLIPVTVKLTGPIGILHFGDPHVDDDGTDIHALERHTKLTRETEGLFGANIGDTTNNWVGRLARLYAEQSTTAKQAWMLAEWFINAGKWLYVVGGNHDAWSGAGDPMKWITRQQGALYRDTEVRLELRFPNGNKVRVNARHDFAGSSQWNPVHGPMKATTMGVRDHIAICGHKHISGYGLIKDPDSGITCHAIRVASYKVFDRYAKEKGFRDQTLSPCAVTVIDPSLPTDHPDLVKVYWEPEVAVDYLKFKRGKK